MHSQRFRCGLPFFRSGFPGQSAECPPKVGVILSKAGGQGFSTGPGEGRHEVYIFLVEVEA